MNWLTEEARERARSYRLSGPSAAHTADMLEALADALEVCMAERNVAMDECVVLRPATGLSTRE